MIIHQTLHGYRDGHRLLAASTTLDPADERRMDALSDLSGYLDKAAKFDHYHTGFPCGPFWVYARTWLDAEAERRGTVLTHSLLIPQEEVVSIEDLALLAPQFRKPSRPFELASYRSALTLAVQPNGTEQVLDPTSRRALALSWFAQDRRPILWEDPANAEAAAQQLWIWMPPWLRPSWSFCTVALQPRYLGDAPLDWMGVAVPASTVFYKLRDTALSAGGRARMEIPEPAWLPLLLDQKPAELSAMWTSVRDGGFGTLPASQLRLALQYLTLDPREDFAARLSQLDILERLGVEGRPVAERAVARALAALPGEAAGLLAAHDLVVRAPHQRAPSEHEQVFQALYTTAHVTGWTAPEQKRLPALLKDARAVGLAPPIERGLVESAADTSSAQDALLRLRALTAADAELGFRALLATRAEVQSALMPHVMSDEALRPLAVANAFESSYEFARVVRDNPLLVPALLPELLVRSSVWSRTDFNEALSPISAAALLASLPPSVQAPGEALVRALARHLANEVNLFEISSRLPPWLPVPLFEAQADRAAERLLAHPSEVLGWWLARPQPPQSTIIAQLVDRADPASLRSMAQPDLLPQGVLGERWASRVLTTTVAEFLEGKVPLTDVGPWLRSAGDEVDRRALREMLADPPSSGLASAVAFLATPVAHLLRDRNTLDRCLRAWRTYSEDARWQARDAWLDLLVALRTEDREAHQALAFFLFGMATKEPRPEGGALAEATFATVHEALHRETARSWLNPLKWIEYLWGADWDRAKHVRQAAAIAWVEGEWPPETLLRIADGDRELLEKLVDRAVKQPGGPMAVAGLKRLNLPSWARAVWLLGSTY